MPKWLEKAVFYEIYPQSFYDANGDGIGDIEGIIQKLDYIKEIGCNAVWINPCFDSPFGDAGYDIRNYKQVAPRYGTNDDLLRLFEAVHRRDMRIVLDLVPGHTSEQHPWFIESKRAEPNEYTNRYIWTDEFNPFPSGLGFIGGEAERPGSYITNFYKCQPALNYGFYKVTEPWQLPMDHPDSIATFNALKDIMRFWLDAGCDGFRVDMAYSIVKQDDAGRNGAISLWQDVRRIFDLDYPEAALIAEWTWPAQAIKAGFHTDFLLHFLGQKGYSSLLRDYPLDRNYRISGEDRSFFNKNGKGDISRFLNEYLFHYEHTKNDGYISLITGNHDIIRAAHNLSPRELSIAWGMIFTMPGIPFLYYGDEIGMRYLPLPTKEGGYCRTGSRTPMQWKAGKNLGFSAADPEKLYLPVDGAPDAPTVEAQEKDPLSLLNAVKALLRLRREHEDLQAAANLEIVYAEKGALPFIYRRGGFMIAVNPGDKEAVKPLGNTYTGKASLVWSVGDCAMDGICRMGAQSFGIWRV
jgi:maltose alpha-D-glucosyltransferase/alpha-amylase